MVLIKKSVVLSTQDPFYSPQTPRPPLASDNFLKMYMARDHTGIVLYVCPNKTRPKTKTSLGKNGFYAYINLLYQNGGGRKKTKMSSLTMKHLRPPK